MGTSVSPFLAVDLMRRPVRSLPGCVAIMNRQTPCARGLHSFSSQLNFSAFCGIAGSNWGLLRWCQALFNGA